MGDDTAGHCHMTPIEYMMAGISPCCKVPVDESTVMPNGHGYRSCSKCGKILWHLRVRGISKDEKKEPEGSNG